MKILTGTAAPLDALAWWSVLYERHTGRAYHSRADYRDRRRLEQVMELHHLPIHQLVTALDRWMERHNGDPVVVDFALTMDDADAANTLVDDDDVVARATMLLATPGLTDRQLAGRAQLEWLLNNVIDLRAAWGPEQAKTDHALALLERAVESFERAGQ